MSYHYLPELAQGCLQQTACYASSASAPSKLTNTAETSSSSVSATASSSHSRSGTMCEPSTDSPGVDAWILSLRASRASHSQPPGSEKAKMTIATDGLTPFALLEKSNQSTYYWKTCQTSLISDISLTQFSEIWPFSSLIAVAVGYEAKCYRLPRSEPRTYDADYGYWQTPVASEWMHHKFSKRAILNKSEKQQDAGFGKWNGLTTQMVEQLGLYPTVEFGEWLMGLPSGWTSGRPLEMAGFRKWLRHSGEW